MGKPETSWRVVLVRPRNPLNIGAAGRAIANFGLKELVVVSPFEPTWREAKSAVGAEALMKSARSVESLEDAIGDATLVVGTTTGRRRMLDRDLISVTELPAWLKRRRSHRAAALLFGSEKTGLSNQDLSFCHAVVRIPTVPNCPSMNLGQAVAVCCYELARASKGAAPQAGLRTHRSNQATMQSLTHLFDRAVRLLDQSGYFHPKSRDAQVLKLRRFFLDRGLTNNDARILGGALAQLEWRLKNK
jgi:TrmH family RNA methyltransferase